MTQERIRTSVASARAYLGAHPDEARYRDSPATAVIERGLRTRTTAPDGTEIISDMTTGVGGEGSAPSPGWLLRAANASCIATLIAMRAAEQQVALDRLEVVVDSESDDRGVLGIDDSVPAGPLSMLVEVRIAAAGASEAQLQELAAWGVAHCPVCDAVKRSVPVEVAVQIG